ncbi:MAG: tryptophan synthase subunit alpha [Deltaproteobacteria bacterium]|nr:tryptophan synthase subunit alpha [Candidatus Anaeroferrophillus wilburensis]MBN2888552.1 tryptophan synthase subunit alpha [Deltaproteobacteria bacterium]
MNRLNSTFDRLRQAGRKALITFITAGDPSLETTATLVATLAENGADIIELGVPFSDPLADGPTIQAASLRALQRGTTLAKILVLVQKIRRTSQVPLVLMSYYNPILRYGVERFVAAAVEAGVDGVIVPDLPLEEGAALRQAAEAKGLAVIQLVAPTSSPERMASLCRASRGFVYYVTVTGITGARRELPVAIADSLQQLQSFTDTPIAAGFGISTPEQASEVGRHADGVIVGSTLVKLIADGGDDPQMLEKLGAQVRALRTGLDGIR